MAFQNLRVGLFFSRHHHWLGSGGMLCLALGGGCSIAHFVEPFCTAFFRGWEGMRRDPCRPLQSVGSPSLASCFLSWPFGQEDGILFGFLPCHTVLTVGQGCKRDKGNMRTLGLGLLPGPSAWGHQVRRFCLLSFGGYRHGRGSCGLIPLWPGSEQFILNGLDKNQSVVLGCVR